MSHFDPVRIRSTLKAALPAVAFACAVTLANPGHAAAYFLQSASMNTTRTAHINGPGGFHAYTYIAPVKFTTYEGTGATPQTGALSGPFDMVGFCLDIFHGISLGTLNLRYDDTYDLTTNSKYQSNASPFTGATPLTQPQITQVGRLVNYGQLVYAQAPTSTDKVNRLAGLQGAIWQVINPGYTVTSGNAALDGYIATYTGAGYANSLTGYGRVGSNLIFLTETGKYGTNAAHQSFGFGGGVPEPGTWTLMIGGFALMGAMLRRARPRLAPAGVRPSV